MAEPISLWMPALRDVVQDLGIPGAMYNFPEGFRWPLPALARQARKDYPQIRAGETLTFINAGRTLVVSATEAHFKEDQ